MVDSVTHTDSWNYRQNDIPIVAHSCSIIWSFGALHYFVLFIAYITDNGVQPETKLVHSAHDAVGD